MLLKQVVHQQVQNQADTERNNNGIRPDLALPIERVKPGLEHFLGGHVNSNRSRFIAREVDVNDLLLLLHFVVNHLHDASRSVEVHCRVLIPCQLLILVSKGFAIKIVIWGTIRTIPIVESSTCWIVLVVLELDFNLVVASGRAVLGLQHNKERLGYILSEVQLRSGYLDHIIIRDVRGGWSCCYVNIHANYFLEVNHDVLSVVGVEIFKRYLVDGCNVEETRVHRREEAVNIYCEIIAEREWEMRCCNTAWVLLVRTGERVHLFTQGPIAAEWSISARSIEFHVIC